MQSQPIPPPSPLYDLPGPLFLILTGQTGDGKSFQLERIARAVAPSGNPAIAPTLILFAEASGEGTMGQLLLDEDVAVVWPVTTCDDAMQVLRINFPEGRGPLTLGESRRARHEWLARRNVGTTFKPPPASPTARDAWPIRSVFAETLSTMLVGQKAAVRDGARTKDGDGRYRLSTGKGAGKELENDQKRIAAIATGPATNLVDALSGVATRHRGTLVACTVHTRGQTKADGEGNTVVVGQAPDFGAPMAVQGDLYCTAYAQLWQNLAAKANYIWHCYATAPVFASAADVNNPDGGEVKFGAVTQRGVYPGLGPVIWPKRQGGEGWLSMMDAAPRLWHADVPWPGAADFAAAVEGLPAAATWNGGPDLGLLLELCLHGSKAGLP